VGVGAVEELAVLLRLSTRRSHDLRELLVARTYTRIDGVTKHTCNVGCENTHVQGWVLEHTRARWVCKVGCEKSVKVSKCTSSDSAHQ
jgi:hypothetical protein